MGSPRDGLLLRCLYYCCRKLAASPIFSAITMLLTLYALFGDDMRLVFTAKPSDTIFDCITVAGMILFALEIFACSLGKAGYLMGFFFWLDLASTVTLVLDITPVAEQLLGDSVSNADSPTSTSGRSAGGDSAEAARAARMSRAGTKAGRVVRLIRLVRLLRLVKLYRRSAYVSEGHLHPGYDWGEEEEEDQNLEKESAVSKKLSEMTTRRVIMLVLVIMLSLPVFQPSLYTEKLPSSAQYGINILYRRFINDMKLFTPTGSPSQRQMYLGSKERKLYVDDFYLYAFYHNPFCMSDQVPSEKLASPLSSFGKLFWVGAGPPTAEEVTYFLPKPQVDAPGATDLNARWNGDRWHYYLCNLTADPAGLLGASWGETQHCVASTVRGLSLLRVQEPRVACPEDLRFQERAVVYPTFLTGDEWEKAFFMFVFDRRSGSRMEALLNTAQTLFICFLLGFGAMTFSKDANKLVLTPIERMISRLEKIRNSPLEAMTIGDEEHRREQVAASRKHRGSGDGGPVRGSGSLVGGLRATLGRRLLGGAVGGAPAPEPMETVVLEKTIIKIGSLLALGFGEAGAEIIGQNMRGGDSSALNAMIPGRRVEAIFGFCDIRNFTDATEVLQDQVMVFVNRIAGVVHSCINEFFGSPNKNIGDAFLLAWRLSGHNARKQQRLADMALISFIKIIAQINKSPLLAEYRNHPKLVKRLPNYRVRMGFGLHSGWAIEGAIGSEFKIDASYLSPNVNMAASLEAVTKQFGCLILISDSLHKLLSELVAEECRLIDHVKIAGSKEAFKLYTIDLDDLALEVDRGASMAHSKNAKFRQRYETQQKKNERWADDFNMHSLFEQDPDVQTMRTKFSVEFFCRFNMAYLNYEAGEWAVAKDMLNATRFLLVTEDGPSAALLRFMKQFNWEAPKAWPGYRVLAEK
eukprot:CAMPEP_0179199838 /NCGR_PEP_ID=MMETSP0796-20121207/99431_1 /TAXON_ID=73915 /ORGANISM="Pyrodinium bahamense, Strain pbaha01" /LENGTH=919 /DNA_ID=CAMNT_0020904351 /DNA_START=1 /DNA_END=2760 /DNA_ORIENTATION=-